jgi:hypothetical protein
MENKKDKVGTILHRILFKLVYSYAKSMVDLALDEALDEASILKNLDKVKSGILKDSAQDVIGKIFGGNGPTIFSEVANDLDQLEDMLLEDVPTSIEVKEEVKKLVLSKLDALK